MLSMCNAMLATILVDIICGVTPIVLPSWFARIGRICTWSRDQMISLVTATRSWLSVDN